MIDGEKDDGEKDNGEKDENGKTIIKALDLDTNTYRKSIKPNLPEIKEAKSIELFDRRLKFLVEGDSNPSKFYREYYSCLLSYAAMCVPEIADEYYQIDDALRTGYAWDQGPFELWDNLGLDSAISMIEGCGDKVPDWISDIKNSGAESFYKFEGGKKKYFDLYNPNKIPIEPFRQRAENVGDLAYHNSGELQSYVENGREYILDSNQQLQLDEDFERELIHGYYACVTFIDFQIGKIINKLKQT